MAKLVMMLRVKDGMFFVEEWLSCYEKLVDEIVVLDNGSTDATVMRLSAHPKVVDLIETVGYNEGRDKNLLYEHVRKRNPDWCIWVDVDEIFESGLTRSDFDILMASKLVNKYAFRRFHFIDRQYFAGSWYRLNYSSGHDRIMWRENRSGYFENLIIDSPNVKGINGLKRNTHFRLKHLGYINKELVDKKAEIYREIIPEKENILQSMYLHGEKKILWVDDRNDVRAKRLNFLLDIIQLSHIFPKIKNRVVKYFKSFTKGNK
ncbi:glycosyltransferase family 2 protein [Mucilaginibacter sp. UYCu711]|uniref:glycosyltransferase family 2 protein n=1 Tax=Mucilaginibacter sp. UYCu711 TaxID=3156339 RepID=UPI003D2368EA